MKDMCHGGLPEVTPATTAFLRKGTGLNTGVYKVTAKTAARMMRRNRGEAMRAGEAAAKAAVSREEPIKRATDGRTVPCTRERCEGREGRGG